MHQHSFLRPPSLGGEGGTLMFSTAKMPVPSESVPSLGLLHLDWGPLEDEISSNLTLRVEGVILEAHLIHANSCS